MDTGAYMANQMDDLITSGIIQHEKECEQLHSDIEKYIADNGFTWKALDIYECYRSYKKGNYISFTAKQVVKHFEERLQKLIQK